MKVVTSEAEDFLSWLNLALEVESLFGPMVSDNSFKHTLRKIILDKQGFCIRANKGEAGHELAGGIIISSHENEIMWFAVANRYRNQGIGQQLLTFALNQLDDSRPVTVSTFDQTVKEGIPARKIYLNNGFVDTDKRSVNPANIPIVLMTRPAKSE